MSHFDWSILAPFPFFFLSDTILKMRLTLFAFVLVALAGFASARPQIVISLGGREGGFRGGGFGGEGFRGGGFGGEGFRGGFGGEGRESGINIGRLIGGLLG